MKLYLNPLNWARWFGQFAIAWLFSIRWTGAWWAIPFVLVLVLMSTGAAIARSSSKTWRNRIISRQLSEASKAQDYKVVELLLNRRLREQPGDPELRLRLAETQVAMEKRDEGLAQFRELALKDRDGRAALWLIQNELKVAEMKNWTAEQYEEFGKLTEVAIAAYPNDERVNAFRADYLVKTGDLAAAIPHMEVLQKRQPMIALQIAALFRAQGDEKKATDAATGALRFIEEKVNDEPKKAELRMLHAQALVFLNETEAAADTLYKGYDLSRDERLRGPLAEALVLHAESLSKEGDGSKDLVKRLQFLRFAIQYAPANPAVIKVVGDTVLAAADDQSPEVIALRESLLKGASPALAHFIRGTVAMMRGDAKTGSFELELAAKDMPQSAAILNNLAVAKTVNAKESGDMAELDKALELVNKALELVSKAPGGVGEQILYFYETRGQIHLLKKNYTDAISDLEKALQVQALKKGVHESLAQAYEGAGIPEMANLHKEASQE